MEHHLASIMDYTNRALLRGENVYITSFDVANAFGNVAHHQQSATLTNFHVDASTHRLVH